MTHQHGMTRIGVAAVVFIAVALVLQSYSVISRNSEEKQLRDPLPHPSAVIDPVPMTKHVVRIFDKETGCYVYTLRPRPDYAPTAIAAVCP